MWDPKADFKTAVLPNGMSVYVATWPDRPWMAANFLIHSGALQDASGREGTAHYLEHVVSENTQLGSEGIQHFFEDLGGNVNLGRTGWRHALYSFFVPVETFPRALEVFGPMLLTGRMERQIERERSVILGEFNRRYEHVWEYDLGLRAARIVHHGTAFENLTTPLGSRESIASISEPDLQSYYEQHYRPKNMSLVAVGGLELDEVLRYLEKSPFIFDKGGLRTARPVARSSVSIPLERLLRISPPGAIDRTSAHYETLALLPGTVDSHVMIILYRMLGEKLFKVVRQKRAWAYAINPSWAHYDGCYALRVSCEGLANEAVDLIDGVVSECIESLKGNREEFENERRRLVLGARLQDGSGRHTANDATDDLIDHGRLITIAEHEAIATQLTQENIDEALGYLDSERRLTVLIAA
jgi:predicted Zn-dependent peptidase